MPTARQVGALLVVVGFSAALAWLLSGLYVTEPVAMAPSPEITTPTPEEVDGPLAELDRRLEAERRFAESHPSYVRWDHLAQAYIDRGRMSGDYRDYQRADEALTRSFGLAPPGAGPFLRSAVFNATMHRIARLQADLVSLESVVLMSPGDRETIASLRADAAFYSGRYDEARELYAAQLAAGRNVASLVAMAQLEWRTGRFDAAGLLLDEAAALDEGDSMRAWALSARAMMERDRGRLEAALTAIRASRALAPEDPHLEQLFAEILEARGNDAAALERYQAIAARTESPQAMDGAARILRAQGDDIAADELVTAARQAYEAQIALFPEAAYGHAIDHWLRLEEDVARTVEIAEGNAEARPYGEARTKLAMAYVLAGRDDDAARELDEIIASGWSSAEVHGARALVAERLSDDARALAERGAAEAIAPGAVDRLGWLAR